MLRKQVLRLSNRFAANKFPTAGKGNAVDQTAFSSVRIQKLEKTQNVTRLDHAMILIALNAE